ncbi:MAG: hypothetical protein HY242_03140 [Afipia sp.]|nr:hypothetical protein [Afipia sp.]
MSANDSVELAQACFELARATKWARKPVDTESISKLATDLADIAKGEICEPLGIDLPIITRAVRYLNNVHAIPPMDDDTGWFYDMLRVVLDIARPNTSVAAEDKEFLRDMLEGIGKSLQG